jgi:hypothetical protein
MRSLAFIPLLLLSVLLLFILACSGGGDDDPLFTPGPLLCDSMGTKSYHYTVKAKQEIKEPEGTPVPGETPPRSAVTLTWDIQGALEGGEIRGSIDSKQHNAAGNSVGEIEIIILENGEAYYKISNTDWRKPSNPDRPQPLQFEPRVICEALSPDVDTTKLGAGVAETINGTPSQKFSFEDLPSEFFSRHPNFGGGSEVAVNIHSISGSIWVAEKGNLVSKVDIIGEGQYPNGQAISVSILLELADLGSDIKVAAPEIA